MFAYEMVDNTEVTWKPYKHVNVDTMLIQNYVSYQNFNKTHVFKIMSCYIKSHKWSA